MNCANHPNVAAVAYCRACGKPVCANCVRDVRGVIYCENCLAEKLGLAPVEHPTGFAPVTPGAPFGPPPTTGYTPVQPQYASRAGGPNPALAGILAGFFPFGVGAVYCGQYAKGLAHLLVFVGFIWGLSHDIAPVLLGLGLSFFYVYQIIDSIKTAHAVQAGQPVPDPFGLASTFSGVDPRPVSDAGAVPGESAVAGKVPSAAVILIGLGVLFLMQTAGVFSFNFDRIWPFFLIGLGGWLIAVRTGYLGHGYSGMRYRRDGTLRRNSGWVGPVVLITVGGLSLIESMGGPDWGRTWPVLLLAIGAIRLIQGSRNSPPASFPPAAPIPPVDPSAEVPPPSEVNRG